MITPVDIENKEFTKSFRGYNQEEVEGYLKEIVSDYSKLYRENVGMKDKNAILTEAVENYKRMEETVQSAIVTAQKTADEILANAHKQADVILKEAKLQAQKMVNEADDKVKEKMQERAEIISQSHVLRAKLRAVLRSHMDMIDELPDEEITTNTEPTDLV